MELSELYKMIDLPNEVAANLNTLSIPAEIVGKYSLLLTNPKNYESAERELSKLLSPDTDGFKMLYVMLCSALISYQKYVEKGISQNIFAASMKSFTRFINETMESFGKYCFDRSWWSGRFLSLMLFRIGELEYEIIPADCEISIHIPSDADLTKTDKSIAESKEFFRKYFPKCKDFPYVCLSWMMSPSLDSLLRKDSNLLKFKSKFEITDFYPNDEGYKQWVFKNISLSPENFPEDTSLQKAMKEFVIAGGKIGEAKGILR